MKWTLKYIKSSSENRAQHRARIAKVCANLEYIQSFVDWSDNEKLAASLLIQGFETLVKDKTGR